MVWRDRVVWRDAEVEMGTRERCEQQCRTFFIFLFTPLLVNDKEGWKCFAFGYYEIFRINVSFVERRITCKIMFRNNDNRLNVYSCLKQDFDKYIYVTGNGTK